MRNIVNDTSTINNVNKRKDSRSILDDKCCNCIIHVRLLRLPLRPKLHKRTQRKIGSLMLVRANHFRYLLKTFTFFLTQ